ncbi:DUF3325 family protein [Stutzerimonas stutzeri]|uniref:DUF3325 domain-containing protein n=1 Tax=Stutzerimonas stutzeri TaxID=316 RepID=A0A0D9AJP4_STUST|nr:DUF3325 family protein [Stutzerimonas stutzeri]KJH79611.1 hypothetical protein UF78_20885 [Stutzerimonas stutzeri]
MPELLASALAFALRYLAFALLALCQPVHRKAVDPLACTPSPASQQGRKLLAAFSLATALALLLALQSSGFGAVLWMLLVSAGAFSLSLTLSWKPTWLRPLLQSIGKPTR